MKKTLISLFCALCLIAATDAQTKKSPVVFDAYEWDFGTVESAEGTVCHTFTFKNNSKELKIVFRYHVKAIMLKRRLITL